MNIISYVKNEHIGILKVNGSQSLEDAAFVDLEEILSAVEKDPEVYVLLLVGSVWKDVSVRMEHLQIPVLMSSEESVPVDLVGCDIVIMSEHPEEEGLKMARQIASNAPIAVQQIKKCVDLGLKNAPETGRAYELQAFALCHATQDKQIGMKALLNNENEKVFLRK